MKGDAIRYQEKFVGMVAAGERRHNQLPIKIFYSIPAKMTNWYDNHNRQKCIIRSG